VWSSNHYGLIHLRKGPVQSAGYILNAGSQQFIQDCVTRLKESDAASLLIFPEGTRTEKVSI
jgi:1-acyl-sn-glycerol-3-phosphate acyltransferase